MRRAPARRVSWRGLALDFAIDGMAGNGETVGIHRRCLDIFQPVVKHYQAC